MDKSKVVHPRIATDILIGCYDMLEVVAGRNTENLSVASVVNDVLTGFVRGAQKEGLIPEYSRADIQNRYEEVFGKDEKKVFTSGFVSPEEEDENLPPREEFLAAIEEEFDNITASAASLKGDLETGVKAEPPKRARPDWEAEEANRFSTLCEIQPLDRFIVQATEADDKVLMKCVSLVYSSLPEDLWGCETAQKAIQDLYEMYCEDHPN